MQFNKLYLSISMLLIGAIWVACVDIPSGPGTNTNPDIRSLVRFVHGVEGVPAGNVSVDGSPVGTSISYLGNTVYLDFPSGSRSFSFGGPDAVVTGLTAEQQSTVVVYRAADSTIAYVNLAEGHMNKNNGVAGFARVKFVNVAYGSSPNVSFRSTTITSTDVATPALGASAQYLQLDPGARSIFALSSGGYKATIAGTASASTGTGTVDFSFNGPLVIGATVSAKNSEGFFTSAGVYGSDGTLLYPLSVASQLMKFDTVKINGANEVPRDTITAAKGTAILTLFRDSLQYAVTVSRDSLDTTFTQAHFHRGIAGVSGPVVKNIIVGAPWSNLTRTFTGTWARTDSLQPLTDALIDDILNQRIYINFHSNAHPGGVIRGQVTSSFTKGGYASTVTGLANTIGDSLNQGLLSFRFSTAAQPGGAISGQLAVKYIYAIDSLTVTDQNFDAGKMYTLIATGKGPTFNILKLEDRRFGVAKPVPAPGAVKRASVQENPAKNN